MNPRIFATLPADVAIAFAIEALLLVDHYSFLDRYAWRRKQRQPSRQTRNLHEKSGRKKDDRQRRCPEVSRGKIVVENCG
ncbi:MAG: hypothetical protein JO185_08555 [Acidobacteriaceae bacterium]|nr:hypothetical protein [Acidobacteriaceae bacterium]MBV9676371.1 hypothetical protein [Acidobacteriaceae bacterium]